MATLGFAFNAAAVPQNDSFDPIPAGDYIAQITESEIKNTKSGTGQMLNLRWQVLDGPFKGRLVFDRINIINQNPDAQRIGQGQLSSLCHILGVLNLTDSSQLHMKPATIKVKIRKDDQYGDSNEVKGYKAAVGAAPVANAFGGVHAPAPSAAPAAPTPPWQKPAQAA